MNLGFVALNSGDYALARGCFEKAVEADPASTDAKLGLAVALRGTKEYDQSAALYDEIIKANPSMDMAYFNAAKLHSKYTKNYGKAQKYLEDFVQSKAGQIGPNHAVFMEIEAVKAAKAEEEERKRLEAQRKKEAEEREKRNKELLKTMSDTVGKYNNLLSSNASCMDEMVVAEGQMILEQAQMVVDAGDVSMAQDINTLLEGYIPTWDEAAAACAGGGGAAPAPAEEAPAEDAPAEEAPADAPAEGG